MAQTFNGHSHRVLVAEDDDDTRSNLCDILELDGYVVSGVSTVAATLAHEHLAEFAAIILDRNLPDGTADDLLPQLNALAPNAICIIITGDADIDGTLTALRQGASDYIIKPVNPDSIRASLMRTRRLVEAEQRAARLGRLAAIGEIVTSVGHESRNALQRINACVELMRLQADDNPEILKTFDVIENASNDLLSMFEELRGFSAPIQLHPRPCDLRELVQRAWDSLQQVPGSKTTALTLSIPEIMLMVDPLRMEQVFRNLFENAIGASAARIDVVANDQMVHGQNMTRIAVHDDGPGFTDQQREQAFQPFFTTKSKGTGLGLPICKRIIDMHGGHIAIPPNERNGASIAISLRNMDSEVLC